MQNSQTTTESAPPIPLYKVLEDEFMKKARDYISPPSNGGKAEPRAGRPRMAG